MCVFNRALELTASIFDFILTDRVNAG